MVCRRTVGLHLAEIRALREAVEKFVTEASSQGRTQNVVWKDHQRDYSTARRVVAFYG